MSTNTAMVWGANGSIGQALVTDLAHQGWQVVAASRSGEEVAGAALTVQADAANERAVEAAVMAVAHEVDEVSLFIYAAGDIVADRVEAMSPTEWQRILGANLDGAYLTTHYCLPLLAEDAQLVYLGAVSERLRLPGLSAYAAAKAGLEAFAEALRKEERKRRILVVRPGAVSTPFWDKVPMRLPKDAATPQKVSDRILQACAEQRSGILDLT